jgi:hypothetical protein
LDGLLFKSFPLFVLFSSLWSVIQKTVTYYYFYLSYFFFVVLFNNFKVIWYTNILNSKSNFVFFCCVCLVVLNNKNCVNGSLYHFEFELIDAEQSKSIRFFFISWKTLKYMSPLWYFCGCTFTSCIFPFILIVWGVITFEENACF